MKISLVAFLCIALILFGAPSWAAPRDVPSGRDIVSPVSYVSLAPVGRGSSFQIAVVLKIRPGFHINAREKSADYLIATDLKAELPPGFKAGPVTYPKGSLQKFSFSKAPLNVYQDRVTLFVPVTAASDAPLGAQHVALKLRYQACSTEVCLPPVTVAVDAVLDVVATSSAAKTSHPEIFATR